MSCNMYHYIEIKSGGANPEPAVELVSPHLDGDPGSRVVGHVHDSLLNSSLLPKPYIFI